jgi:DNA polymerase III delta prime subunit
MPKREINYTNTYFYKIVCKDLNITDFYVGHTTNFIKRKASHKNACNNITHKAYNCYVYKFIRDNEGWDNWDMILIDTITCDNKLDALKKEREYIEQLKATLNKVIPARTKKEYYKMNKDKFKEYYETNKEDNKDKLKQYREQNRDKMKEYMKKYNHNIKQMILSYKNLNNEI